MDHIDEYMRGPARAILEFKSLKNDSQLDVFEKTYLLSILDDKNKIGGHTLVIMKQMRKYDIPSILEKVLAIHLFNPEQTTASILDMHFNLTFETLLCAIEKCSKLLPVDCCLIYLKAFDTSVMVMRMQCNHVFHAKCLTQWLQVLMCMDCPRCHTLFTCQPSFIGTFRDEKIDSQKNKEIRMLDMGYDITIVSDSISKHRAIEKYVKGRVENLGGKLEYEDGFGCRVSKIIGLTYAKIADLYLDMEREFISDYNRDAMIFRDFIIEVTKE